MCSNACSNAYHVHHVVSFMVYVKHKTIAGNIVYTCIQFVILPIVITFYYPQYNSIV